MSETTQSAGALRAWMSRGSYLPKCLRDFHAQKDVFKCVDEQQERRIERQKQSRGGRPDPLAEAYRVPWTNAHVYTIDHFLWFMAVHGWTLQRSRQPYDFADLDATVRERREREFAESPLRALFKQRPADAPPAEASADA